jgi:hypothetical protein
MAAFSTVLASFPQIIHRAIHHIALKVVDNPVAI